MARRCAEIKRDNPNAIFFSGKKIFPTDDWFTRRLHKPLSMVPSLRTGRWINVNCPDVRLNGQYLLGPPGRSA
ncbi:hypothetical protein F2P45_17500 [Massilia sp. CCM 8733]|uniref:Uncharacterized protein n=1 Tax=Massilia mucilaginosa TaxID=2609282 RepID=A0ABX0NV23_9BURK|nr:hypothetical protein [Massilia mucilaginosa]NHZ90804.1 hypothetical protein [Massilia mucilaginosa]